MIDNRANPELVRQSALNVGTDPDLRQIDALASSSIPSGRPRARFVPSKRINPWYLRRRPSRGPPSSVSG
jgi:hypothetical protein